MSNITTTRKSIFRFQFDAVVSDSIIWVLRTRENFKKDDEIKDTTEDWNIYLVREKKFSRTTRRKLSEDEINNYLKKENAVEKTVFTLEDFMQAALSECSRKKEKSQ